MKTTDAYTNTQEVADASWVGATRGRDPDPLRGACDGGCLAKAARRVRKVPRLLTDDTTGLCRRV